jgi:hypothetical protein
MKNYYWLLFYSPDNILRKPETNQLFYSRHIKTVSVFNRILQETSLFKELHHA